MFDSKKLAREFVASIGYPVGAFSPGGLDERALIKLLEATYERGKSDERKINDLSGKTNQRS